MDGDVNVIIQPNTNGESSPNSEPAAGEQSPPAAAAAVELAPIVELAQQTGEQSAELRQLSERVETLSGELASTRAELQSYRSAAEAQQRELMESVEPEPVEPEPTAEVVTVDVPPMEPPGTESAADRPAPRTPRTGLLALFLGK